MIIGSDDIANRLEKQGIGTSDPFVIAPMPDLKTMRESGSASIDLRLGTWFITNKARKHHVVDFYSDNTPGEDNITNKYYIPFEKDFILHPRHFVLAVTLEWIRMPLTMAGYVTGKSSWGRHGLIIETAPGVHPGFTGCLTLELTNVGEIPIAIRPGARICQLFCHSVQGGGKRPDLSHLIGRRQPFLGKITPDNFEKNLRK